MKDKKETKQNIEAFKLYSKLRLEGDKEAFEKVADAFGVKKKTVYNWSHHFKWEERYREIEKEANRKALEQLTRDIESQDIKMVERAITNLRRAEMSVAGSLDGFYSPKDYETMVKVYLLLTGRATDRVETSNDTNHTITEADKETIEKFVKKINEDIMSSKIEIKGEEKEEEND